MPTVGHGRPSAARRPEEDVQVIERPEMPGTCACRGMITRLTPDINAAARPTWPAVIGQRPTSGEGQGWGHLIPRECTGRSGRDLPDHRWNGSPIVGSPEQPSTSGGCSALSRKTVMTVAGSKNRGRRTRSPHTSTRPDVEETPVVIRGRRTSTRPPRTPGQQAPRPSPPWSTSPRSSADFFSDSRRRRNHAVFASTRSARPRRPTRYARNGPLNREPGLDHNHHWLGVEPSMCSIASADPRISGSTFSPSMISSKATRSASFQSRPAS